MKTEEVIKIKNKYEKEMDTIPFFNAMSSVERAADYGFIKGVVVTCEWFLLKNGKEKENEI